MYVLQIASRMRRLQWLSYLGPMPACVATSVYHSQHNKAAATVYACARCHPAAYYSASAAVLQVVHGMLTFGVLLLL